MRQCPDIVMAKEVKVKLIHQLVQLALLQNPCLLQTFLAEVLQYENLTLCSVVGQFTTKDSDQDGKLKLQVRSVEGEGAGKE